MSPMKTFCIEPDSVDVESRSSTVSNSKTIWSVAVVWVSSASTVLFVRMLCPASIEVAPTTSVASKSKKSTSCPRIKILVLSAGASAKVIWVAVTVHWVEPSFLNCGKTTSSNVT